MKNIHLLSIISIFAILVAQNEFSQGPYGTGYFDTAAPFSLVDLSTQPQGDINNDEVILVASIINNPGKKKVPHLLQIDALVNNIKFLGE